ncbi:reverse transcriptase/maturase family protein [Laceyella putida]|uniref:Reverse transcriptase domain-containing protein n=1 Tax=Laceyella putida TaxID=110101 RepID=A0ABW2RKK7_9BACL
MRNPEAVLNSLASKSNDPTYSYHRLYRNLYNREFFLLAYGKLAPKEGNMTEGADGKTVDGMSLARIDKLIEKLKDQSYQPNPVKRTYIPKANGKKRPLGIPSIDDKLVQEVVRRVLEAIYEGSFSNHSHGFRPNRSCHTALMEIQRNFTGVKWFIEGDIKGFFDNIDHHILIGILRKRIKDEKFINLIWKFLRAGYVEDWKYHGTYSGTPQGGIISPILSNIYLNELDRYVEELMERFKSGTKRKVNPEYKRIDMAVKYRKDKLKRVELTADEQQKLREEIKSLSAEKLQVAYSDPMDSDYKRLFYTRYADDFIIGVIGSKGDAVNIKAELTEFLSKKLKLELSQEKTLITHASEKARFLGYDISVPKNESTSRDKNGVLKRSNSQKCKLYLPREKWVEKLKQLQALKIDKDGKWKAMHREEFVNLDDIEILSIYNAEIRGLYNYYRLANNVSALNKFFYFMRFSLYKTLANKYKMSVSGILNKYNKNGVFMVEYPNRNGIKTRTLYNGGFKRVEAPLKSNNVDEMPNTRMYGGKTSLIERLLAEECEWCVKKDVPLEVHHIRKLKELQGKKKWEQTMIARKRKTMVLCTKCHDDLHAGRLD